MKNFKAQGIIIKAQDFSEFDQILTIYTRELGKIKAIVKGVKKPKSKLRGGVQLFSYCQLELFKGKSFYRVIHSSSLKSFIELREDFDKMTSALEWLEVVDSFVQEEEVDEETFLLTLLGIASIACGDTVKSLRAFETKLLVSLGYLPSQISCLRCSSKGKVYFSRERQEFYCEKCGENRGNMFVEPEAIMVMKFFTNNDIRQIDRLKVSDRALKQIENVLKQLIEVNLGRELKIFKFK